jgi:hypothetical protein
VRPTTLSVFTGYTYICTTGGTSHATTEPTWPTTIGGTVNDNGVIWTCQADLDYSNYPMMSLHDWDITPDGKLFIPYNLTTDYKLMIVGIKPLYFTGSGTSETIDISTPHDLFLSAQTALFLCQQRVASSVANEASRWLTLAQTWRQTLEERRILYRMLPPAGTIISGDGASV